MYKYAFLILSVFASSAAQAQQSECTKGNPTCPRNTVCVLPWQGIAPTNDTSGTCMTQSEADAEYKRREDSARNGQVPPSFNNGPIDEEKTPKISTGRSTNPCPETLLPRPTTQTISWLDILEKMRVPQTAKENKNTAPQKAYPLPAGPTTSGFISTEASCAMTLAQQGPGTGSQIPAADLAAYNACRQQGRLIDCANALYKALEENPDFDEIIKKRCPALPPNTNASVIDAVWGFLTHKRIY